MILILALLMIFSAVQFKGIIYIWGEMAYDD